MDPDRSYRAAGLRRVCHADTPGMAAEGLLWLPDLALPDPTYALPILLCASSLLTIEVRRRGRGRREQAGWVEDRRFPGALTPAFSIIRLRWLSHQVHALRAATPAPSPVLPAVSTASAPAATPSATPLQQTLTRVFRTFCVLMVPVAAQVPAGLTLYWAASSLLGLAQTLALRYPAVRRALRVPVTPSETRKPVRDLLRSGVRRTRAFWLDVRAKNFAPPPPTRG